MHLPSAAPLRAAVIGGGLGGLTCCNALRKVGIDAQVFERAQKLSPQAGTGLTLWPNGLSALAAATEKELAAVQVLAAPAGDAAASSPPRPTKPARRLGPVVAKRLVALA